MCNTTLRIAEVETVPGAGLIGITFAPGKKQLSAFSGHHDRSLSDDLDVIAAWNSAAVVTLVESFELSDLKIGDIGSEVRKRFMEFHHLPIEDVSVPGAEFEAAWPENSARIRSLLANEANVLIHCKGGLGRAGMVSARILVEMGVDAVVAIARVREARPGAIETEAQRRWVESGQYKALTSVCDLVTVRDRALGALLGLAVGDAVGTTIEFKPKPDHPILTDMVGGGPFHLSAGEFTDDTSMALALAESLTVNPGPDPHDLMSRFVDWFRNGAWSCTGTCFDIGNATREALSRYELTGDPLAGSPDPSTAGNGALMRLSPVAIRHWQEREALLEAARIQTIATHAAAECVEASMIFAEILADAIAGAPLAEILSGPAAAHIKGGWRGKHRNDVRGSGYVVHTLNAAVWAVARTTDFRSAILLAANLGEDADTTAAVAGQLAGAIYGLSGIPQDWRDRVAWGPRIEGLADQLFREGYDSGEKEAVRP